MQLLLISLFNGDMMVMKLEQKSFWRYISMNGMIPKFLEGRELESEYFETPIHIKMLPPVT